MTYKMVRQNLIGNKVVSLTTILFIADNNGTAKDSQMNSTLASTEIFSLSVISPAEIP